MSEAAGSEPCGTAEAILIVVDEPVITSAITEALGIEESVCGELFENLAAEYRRKAPGSHAHGFPLRWAAGGWRFTPVPEHVDLVGQFVVGGATVRLSQVVLETLVTVACRQSVTRGCVAQIRGVNIDGVMCTLHARGLTEEADAETSGTILYRTTGNPLEYLGIDSLDELPPLTPYLPRVEALEEIVERVDEITGRRTL